MTVAAIRWALEGRQTLASAQERLARIVETGVATLYNGDLETASSISAEILKSLTEFESEAALLRAHAHEVRGKILQIEGRNEDAIRALLAAETAVRPHPEHRQMLAGVQLALAQLYAFLGFEALATQYLQAAEPNARGTKWEESYYVLVHEFERSELRRTEAEIQGAERSSPRNTGRRHNGDYGG